MIEFAANFQKYNAKKQRVALFIQAKDNFSAEIVEIKCSKNDNFSKKYAREQYQKYLKNQDIEVKPTKFKVELLGHSPKYTLNKFANDNYYNLVTQIIQWEKSNKNHIVSLELNKKNSTLTAKTLTK